jgi:hypothetical protein
MNVTEQLSNAKIEAEDIIADFDRVILRARRGLVRRPAREIHAASPELFEVCYAIVNAHDAAVTAKADLLRAIGMSPDTDLVRSLPNRS